MFLWIESAVKIKRRLDFVLKRFLIWDRNGISSFLSAAKECWTNYTMEFLMLNSFRGSVEKFKKKLFVNNDRYLSKRDIISVPFARMFRFNSHPFACQRYETGTRNPVRPSWRTYSMNTEAQGPNDIVLSRFPLQPLCGGSGSEDATEHVIIFKGRKLKSPIVHYKIPLPTTALRDTVQDQ